MYKYKGANIDVVHKELPVQMKKFLSKQKSVSIKQFYNNRLNFFIIQKQRVGKTWFLHSIANHIINVYGEKSIYYTRVEKLQQYFTEFKDPRDVDSMLHILSGARVLFIDDLGLEYHKGDSEFSRAKFEDFLRQRLSSNKITYIASKIWKKDFVDFYSESLYDFIVGEYIVLDIVAEDSFNIGRSIITKKLGG